ncbi:MAG TPA: NADP-specific glutamate dehydrogenase [Candidatus Thermoplasmatota archaeon]|nr:NADP-specific glutamate dehydrogenase [Candidatus Thermoplasmatota archaeon]
MEKNVESFMQKVKDKDPGEKEFHQAVQEVVESLMPYIKKHPKYKKAKILERMVEPERTIMFRVPWVDDQGEVHVNRGFRVEFNSAIGPYKGGLRFHPSVNLSTLKFLGFEQTFKNSLTSLPMGGGKGGADFNARGRSEQEIMRFCQAFMTELSKYIGPNTDVPAGDIGVGGREIGFMFGQYKKIKNEFVGVLTGKGINWGGSLIRPEATGFGGTYFAQQMLKLKKETFKGKKVALSGFGNVAWGAAIKISELGGKVVTISGPDGYVYDPDGVSGEKIDYLLEMRASNRDRSEDYADKYSVDFIKGKKPWEVDVDIAMPSAIQNELDGKDAKKLIDNDCILIAEISNMGCTPEAIKNFQNANIMFAPGKAVNAGGVAVSGLEMSQNSLRYNWSEEEVDKKLHNIMENIHESCVKYGKQEDYVNYVDGANIAGFVKVADAMIDQGVV